MNSRFNILRLSNLIIFNLIICNFPILASAPNISGSAARIISDKQTSQPFSDLDITGASDVIVTISFPAAQAKLTPTNELFSRSGDVYTLALTNTSDAVGF